MKKNILKILLKMIAIIASIYGIIKSYESLITFSYFTILSNIFIDIMLLCSLINYILILTKDKRIMNDKLYITKFLATISISLTFFVFMFLLSPTYPGGIMVSYFGNGCSSLCVHFITPLIAIIDFIFFDLEYKAHNKHVIYSLIPPIVYLIFVLILSFVGVRWGGMAAPYNFLNYKAQTGWFGFDLSLRSWETLGIGVIYMVIILIIIFALFAKGLLQLKRNKE